MKHYELFEGNKRGIFVRLSDVLKIIDECNGFISANDRKELKAKINES